VHVHEQRAAADDLNQLADGPGAATLCGGSDPSSRAAARELAALPAPAHEAGRGGTRHEARSGHSGRLYRGNDRTAVASDGHYRLGRDDHDGVDFLSIARDA
jgi:hypothetical protein